MRINLEERYNSIFEKYHLERPVDGKKINKVLKSSLIMFLKDSQNPAIYCSGGHTRMLMADFMFELKKVKTIVDNYAKADDNAGFKYIKDEDIEAHKIDAIVISTYKFRSDVVKSLKEKHVAVRVLDIYEELEKNGIHLEADYYYSNHPYQHYHTINSLKRQLNETVDEVQRESIYRELVTKFLYIKDFMNAVLYAKEWNVFSKTAEVDSMIKDIEGLYSLELDTVEKISAQNVLMLCIDGLRRTDLFGGGMPQLEKSLKEQAYLFKNAYSYSTSTYESLIPVYSENRNLQTEYFKKNVIVESDCRFVNEAKAQGRKICFYADMDHYVESEDIKYSEVFQTATEKIWNFIVDAAEEENGLFYIHILYESHYTFSNPYTNSKLLSEGTAMLFDYLPQKGGKLRADYKLQHDDTLRYLDDVLTPFISRLNCGMVLYADHGNLVLEKDTKEQDMPETKLTFDEEWIQIPMVIKAPYINSGESHTLISLMSLNDIVVSLLHKERYQSQNLDYIKVARSELYNPDFRFLYKKLDKEKYLQAFEMFIFKNMRKLAIYADGTVELYDGTTDKKMENPLEKETLLSYIIDEITVCKKEDIKI